MPIYDYRCDHCGHEFSAVQSFKDAQIDTCPKCGKPPRKLLVSPAIVFKGSGWYKTDSRKTPKSESNGGKSDAKSDTKADTKSGTTSDTKSETKSGSNTPSPKSEGSS